MGLINFYGLRQYIFRLLKSSIGDYYVESKESKVSAHLIRWALLNPLSIIATGGLSPSVISTVGNFNHKITERHFSCEICVLSTFIIIVQLALKFQSIVILFLHTNKHCQNFRTNS